METGRDHVRGSALLVLGRVLAMLLGIATQVILVRALPKSDFGAFAYALAIANAARVLLSLGQGKLLSRFMATYDEQADYPRMFGAMFLAIGTIFMTSLVLAVPIYLFPHQLIGSAVDDDTAVRLVLVLLILSPIEALDLVFVSLFAVFSKPRAIFFRKHLVAPGLRLVAVCLLVLTHANVTFLAVGYVLAAMLGIAVYTLLLVGALRQRDLLKELRLRRIVLPFGAVFSFSFPLITGEIALLATTVGGVMVLGLYHPTTEVANYRAVFSSARLNTAISGSFATLFLPMIARLFAKGDVRGLRLTYWHTAAFVGVFTFPIFALTGPLASSTTVTLFGQKYAGSGVVLGILSVGYYVNVMLGFNAYALQVTGRLRFLFGVNVGTTVLNLGLCFLLAPGLGAVGVAAANSVALLSQNVLNQMGLRKDMRSAFIDRGCWSCYGSILLGTLVLWAFAVTASPGVVGSLVAAVLVSLAVFAVSRRALLLADTFPELTRLPVLGRFLA